MKEKMLKVYKLVQKRKETKSYAHFKRVFEGL